MPPAILIFDPIAAVFAVNSLMTLKIDTVVRLQIFDDARQSARSEFDTPLSQERAI